jgi:hypothetical protein
MQAPSSAFKNFVLGGRELKENDGILLRHIISTFENITMYPRHNKNMLIKFLKKKKKKNLFYKQL